RRRGRRGARRRRRGRRPGDPWGARRLGRAAAPAQDVEQQESDDQHPGDDPADLQRALVAVGDRHRYVDPPEVVGPGSDPGPALVSLVYVWTVAVIVSKGAPVVADPDPGARLRFSTIAARGSVSISYMKFVMSK